MEITVIGNKSSNRIKLVKNVIKALKELDINVIPNILDDNKNLKKYKNTPILIINENVVSTGKVLTDREIKHYIKLFA